MTSSSLEGTWILIVWSVYSQQPTSADREAYEALKNTVPSVATYPNTFAWWVLIHRFNDVVRNTWAGPAPAKGAEKKAAPAKKEDAPEKKEEAPAKKEEAAPKKADDDEMDLFGDDDEDDAVSISVRECSLGSFQSLFNRY